MRASAARRPTGGRPPTRRRVAEARKAGVDPLDRLAQVGARRLPREGARGQVLLDGELGEAMPPFEHLHQPLAHERCRGCARAMGRPRNETAPAFTRPRSAASSPEAALSVVVLPAPFAPSKATTPRSGTSRDTPSQRDDDVVVDDLHGVEREEGRRRRRAGVRLPHASELRLTVAIADGDALFLGVLASTTPR